MSEPVTQNLSFSPDKSTIQIALNILALLNSRYSTSPKIIQDFIRQLLKDAQEE